MADRKPDHFFVGQLADGRFVAATASSPYFCFRADSEEAAIDRVREALTVYGEFRDLGTPTLVPPAHSSSLTTLNASRRVAFSEVCTAA